LNNFIRNRVTAKFKDLFVIQGAIVNAIFAATVTLWIHPVTTTNKCYCVSPWLVETISPCL